MCQAAGSYWFDEAVEDSSPSDLVGREIGWRRLEWLRRPTVQGSVGPVLVVVRQAHGEYCSQVTFMEGYRKPFSVSLLTGVSVPQ